MHPNETFTLYAIGVGPTGTGDHVLYELPDTITVCLYYPEQCSAGNTIRIDGGAVRSIALSISHTGSYRVDLVDFLNVGEVEVFVDPVPAATPVPTISNWALGATAILLLASGLLWRRRIKP